ncbi:MAG: hypothetical protein P1V51_12690 [Deltaproteobacteria bacterium]|nr:hypothetical protein [Deltaproteobacteria bacterium]
MGRPEQMSLLLPLRREARPKGEQLRLRAQALSNDLASRLAHPVKLVVTDNRSSVLTIREDDDAFHIRAHHIFLSAGDEVREALAAYALGRKKRSAGKRLDAFIDSNLEKIRSDPAASPRAPADPEGEHHDLKEIFEELNREYFGGKIAARIGWSSWGPRKHRRRRSIKMGTYLHDARLIRIHPALDDPEVPKYYLAWVVFHEMLHQLVPPVRKNGRTYYHPPAFRKLEKTYREAAQAKAWEEANFRRLLLPRSEE